MKRTIFVLCLLSGICLLYIGIRVFLDPVAATVDYGISDFSRTNFSFQYVKGARDFFFGAIIIVFLLKKYWSALGWVLLLGAIVPVTDFCIVISNPDFATGHTIAHLIAAAICLVGGIFDIGSIKRPDH